MNTKERRERERQITRQAILTAVLEIARKEGWSALTIRKVGAAIEYSPSIIYEYFGRKEDILQELLQEGFQQLVIVMQGVREQARDGDEWIVKMADAYWRFAASNQELYQLMHGLSEIPLNKSLYQQAAQEVCKIIMEALQEWAQEKHVVLEDALGAAELIWGQLHGLVTMSLLVDRIGDGEHRAKRLMHYALQCQLTAWKMAQKGI